MRSRSCVGWRSAARQPLTIAIHYIGEIAGKPNRLIDTPRAKARSSAIPWLDQGDINHLKIIEKMIIN
jgi:hypothetical protein